MGALLIGPWKQIPAPLERERGPLELEMLERAHAVGYKPEMELRIYDSIAARFGDQCPKDGVIHTRPTVLRDGTLYIDSYGRGCISNNIHNPYKVGLTKRGMWNRPMPFPSDLVKIYEAIKHHKGPIQLGLKSEPCPWMDQKYGVFKEILRMLGDRSYTVFTTSDLIAHDDYVRLLSPKATVKMRIPFIDEQQLRIDEPGNPSKLRRKSAVQKLQEHSVDVLIETSQTWEKI